MDVAELLLPDPERKSIADTHDLPKKQFDLWWHHLASEDKDEFTHLYQGDELLARFVCALDYLTIAGVQSTDQQALIQLAYYIAAKPYPKWSVTLNSADLRVRAARAWSEDAVQELLGRVRYRSTKQRRMKLENLVFAQAEELIRDVAERDGDGKPLHPIKARVMALAACTKLMETADLEDTRLRAERTKRGLERARSAMNEAAPDDDDVLEAQVRAIAQKIGPEKMKALLK